jgi:hypothetical protein
MFLQGPIGSYSASIVKNYNNTSSYVSAFWKKNILFFTTLRVAKHILRKKNIL